MPKKSRRIQYTHSHFEWEQSIKIELPQKKAPALPVSHTDSARRHQHGMASGNFQRTAYIADEFISFDAYDGRFINVNG